MVTREGQVLSFREKSLPFLENLALNVVISSFELFIIGSTLLAIGKEQLNPKICSQMSNTKDGEEAN